MDLYTIDARKYKAIFFQTLASKALFIIGTFVLLKAGIYILDGFDPGKKLTMPILIAMIVLSIVHQQYQARRLVKLQAISEFDLREQEYEKFYKFRLVWYFFSCLISCVLAVLTGRFLFLYFAIFDLVISLPFYPSLFLFKKELKNEEVLLH